MIRSVLPSWLFPCLLLALLLPGAAAASTVEAVAPGQAVSPEGGGDPAQPEAEAPTRRTYRLGARRALTLLPAGDLYPQNIADPLRPSFAVQRLSFSASGIADTGDDRFGLKLGGRLGLLRIHPVHRPEVGWQLSLDVGFIGQFDIDHSEDNVGWDGIYGVTSSFRPHPDLALKLGIRHTSAHIGDEIMARTGRQRIGYTREEAFAGISWAFARGWRTYTEAGWGYVLRNQELQQPGRAQMGLEYQAPAALFRGRAGWYAAVDAAATEERGWEVSVALQIGLMVAAGRLDRHWRLGIEHYDGRALLGEFFQDDERHTALGVWLDL